MRDPEKELKIALVIDDYKLPNKKKWWEAALKKTPHIERDYDLVREESSPGLSENTTCLFRFYKLKEPA